MMTSESTSVIEAIENLAERYWKTSGHRIAFEELSSHWHDIGESLNFPQRGLSEIALKFDSNKQRMCQIILLGSRGKGMNAIRDAVIQLNNPLWIEVISVYIKFNQQGQFGWPLKSYGFQLPHNIHDFNPSILQYIHVHHNDLSNIVVAIMKHCPAKWYEFGLMLRIPKSLLDKMDRDKPDIDRKLIEMLDTWIHNKQNNTWLNLIDALKKIQFVAENPDIAPVRTEEVSYQSLNGDYEQHREECFREKSSVLTDLRETLNVNSTVPDEKLISNLGTHIREADLHTKQLKEVVMKVEILEDTMSRHSGTIRKWAVVLRKDLKTAGKIRKKLVTRKQNLERLQQHLKNEVSEIKHVEGDSISELSRDIESKLRYINEEIVLSIKEIDRANADYESISNKLNACQIQLEASIEEHEKLHDVVESCTSLVARRVIQDVAIFCKTVIVESVSLGNSAGSNVGRALVGDCGAAFGGAIGASLFGILGFALSLFGGGVLLLIGITEVTAHKIYGAVFGPPDWQKRFKKLSESTLKELEENKLELQAIQDILNKPKHL